MSLLFESRIGYVQNCFPQLEFLSNLVRANFFFAKLEVVLFMWFKLIVADAFEYFTRLNIASNRYVRFAPFSSWHNVLHKCFCGFVEIILSKIFIGIVVIHLSSVLKQQQQLVRSSSTVGWRIPQKFSKSKPCKARPRLLSYWKRLIFKKSLIWSPYLFNFDIYLISIFI